MLLTHGDSKIKGKPEDFKILAKMYSTFGELWVQFLFSVEGILPGVVIDGGVLSRHHRKALWVYYMYFWRLVSAHIAFVTMETYAKR